MTDGAPKEGELIAERPASVRLQMAGVVPPLGLKAVMTAMVEGEMIGVARPGVGKFSLLWGLGRRRARD